MVSHHDNHAVLPWLPPHTAKRYNELYPKKEKEKKKDRNPQPAAAGKKEESKKKETVTNDAEEDDDTPREPKFKDPYADLPKR